MARARRGSAVVTSAPWIRKVLFATTLAIAAQTTSSGAAILDDWQIPDVAPGDRNLSLYSCGLREILWTELYSVAIYLPDEKLHLEGMRDHSVDKAMRVEIVYDGNIPDGLPAEWRARLREVLNRDALATFRDLYNEIVEGDVLEIGYRASAGSQVRLNGRDVAIEAGHDLIDALLDLWVGAEPVSKNLRRLLRTPGC